ncbi:hypothetical protein B0H34DRAFT_796241 [Crassisporium funariophilum]|nr:hypothetical protein B0H34DRAFT_796241 [Crassisporium funariophilum]
MIITDSTDAASTHTLVATNKIPRYLVHLTYASLGFSILPFIFALINVSLSPFHSIPTIIAYVFTTTFHVATVLVAWQNARDIDTTLPFEPSGGRSIAYICFLFALWIYSLITCAFGSRMFINGFCTFGSQFGMNCAPNHYSRILATFVVSTVLAGSEVLIIGAIGIVCYRQRPQKEKPIALVHPAPKVVSA